jgi:transposase
MSAPATPHKALEHKEADTVKKSRFFEAFDARTSQSIRSIAVQHGISERTATYWLNQRQNQGSPAYRRGRKLSKRLGRQPQLTDEQLQHLLSPSNPVRNQHYAHQIEHFGLSCGIRTLQTALRDRANHAGRYKSVRIKQLSSSNKEKRKLYGKEHQEKTIEKFGANIYFTDEAHIDPSEVFQQYILREEGTRYEPESIQELPEKKGTKLHIATWINWQQKAERLEFYNDENDHLEPPKRPSRPRRSRYETEEQFQQRIVSWEANLPHEVETKPKGNSMTQKYYTERLLPVYIKAIQEARIAYGQDIILQEDNDPSHGTKSELNVAKQLKDSNWITVLIRPAQSQDLNPMEAILGILKQRIRRRRWDDIKQLKEVLQDEWSKITMQEVRAHMIEMPSRCRTLANSDGKAIRSSLW